MAFIAIIHPFSSRRLVAFKTKLIFKGSSLRITQTFVMIVIGFVMMPFMISVLGEELYGLWIVISSVVGTYYLLDMGFAQAITRYVAKYIHQNNPDAANRVINTALALYSALGILVLLISVIGAQVGVDRLMEGSENAPLAKILLVLAGISLAIEFPAKSFPGIVSAYMRFDFIALIRTFKAVADALLMYLFLSLGYGLVAIAIITLVTGTISNVIYVRFTSSLFKELQFNKQMVDLDTLKDVFHFSKWVFLFDVNTMIRNKMDIWFIAFYQTNAVLTIYYVAVRLTEYALQFLTQATGITGPIFTEYYAKNEQQKLQQSVLAFLKLNLLLGSIFLVGFYLVGESFIRLWMGEDFAAYDAYLCLIILALGRFSVYFSSPLQSLLLTLNRHNLGALTSVVETITSAVLLWFLVPTFGIVGAAIAIAVPTMIGRLMIIPILVSQTIKLKFSDLYVRAVVFIILTGIYLAICKRFEGELTQLRLPELLLVSPALGIAQMLLGIILFNKVELQWLLQKLKRKRTKRIPQGRSDIRAD